MLVYNLILKSNKKLNTTNKEALPVKIATMPETKNGNISIENNQPC